MVFLYLKLSEAIKLNKSGEYGTLSSKFYSLIPHDFGFAKMSNFILKTSEEVQKKTLMLQDLSDLKIATQLLKSNDSDDSVIDENYKKLNAEIKEVSDVLLFLHLSDYYFSSLRLLFLIKLNDCLFCFFLLSSKPVKYQKANH